MKNIPVVLLRLVLVLTLFSRPAGMAASSSSSSQIAPPQLKEGDAGHTPLHRAALRGDADAVEALLKAGADPNATNQAGATPLHYATGSERMVAALLARGARADAVSKANRTPLLIAVLRTDSFAVARRLIEAGANVNFVPSGAIGPRANAGVLAAAILGGDRRTIDLLLEHKAEVNPPTFAPLGIAAQFGDLETVRRLIERGADLNKGSPNTGSPLNLSLVNGHPVVARLLIEQGADLHVKSVRGYATPPMVLSGYNTGGDATIARLLVAHGVDVNTANEAGETALSFALKDASDNELIRFLRDAGAKPSRAPVRAKTIPTREVPTDAPGRVAMVRDSAQRAIDLLQHSSTAFLQTKHVRDQARCVSCHQQALPAIASGWARERGLRVDEHELGRQLAQTFELRKARMMVALELELPTPGATTALGHDADGLHALRYASDEVLEAMSYWLLAIQRTDGSWFSFARRVPMEENSIDATAWSTRAVQLYPPKERSRDVETALRRAREWLARQQTHTLNDRVFQLLGLAWSNETTERLRPFAAEIAKEQRADGGWAQMPALASDAWATGSALVALHKAGIATSDPAYRRGVEFLLRTQFEDGSWWVRSRTWPFQPHFDSQFPHGKDQWISAAGTAWATMALLLTLDPTVTPEKLPNAQQLIATFRKSEADANSKRTAAASPSAPISSKAGVDFFRDIQPIFERSCAGCHGGARPKSGFALASRAALLKGGQSGEAAVVPGHADQSPMIKQISGLVEDLEMPPLNRREKYPALTADEIARLRTWIEAGAPWPESHSMNILPAASIAEPRP